MNDKKNIPFCHHRASSSPMAYITCPAIQARLNKDFLMLWPTSAGSCMPQGVPFPFDRYNGQGFKRAEEVDYNNKLK
jgi:hypothetical protein